ncbi:hypothetical protein GGI15_001675 [Coemansia interrupta]|uniref:Uncharacterized protein n=1 Tax=Coemansia interrupta TaxID=1126814 RepID=A0A9W8HHA0_9FUNG|nr:hypothetical protein GGI15_001675 [Coemansia interrupta]
MEHESISRLMAEVSAQREQAARFARMVEEEDEGSAGESPPASFLADYAHELVERYRPAKPPPRIIGRRRRGRRREKSEAAPLEPPAPAALAPRRTLDRSEDGSIDEARQPRADASMVSKIDRSSREQLWSRFGGGRARDDEQRVAALVHMAEQLSLADAPPASPGVPQPPRQPADSPAADVAAQLWAADEWTQWAAFLGDDAADGPVDVREMRRRLEWVHERQADAWRHGFRDHVLANGKLRRTYRGLAVVLDAYPDGNVKRVAHVAGDAEVATTLFFANGDWQCEVDPGPGPQYYYYSQEQVWCCQKPDGTAENRYADGRVEHVDAAGTSTVTYGSGEVVVQLGAGAA